MYRVAVLYDIHGNLAALEAVLAEAEAAEVDTCLFGGDYATFGPWPRETVERLDDEPAVHRLRGNVERWLVEPPEVPDEARGLVEAAVAVARAELGVEHVARLYALPEQAELDGALFCHASPLSDIDSFAPEEQAGEERLLAGVRDRLVVFGHSHVQFHRPGPNGTELLNPGSVGMPLDGDTRAAWVLRENGRFELRRTEYDVERAVTKMRAYGDWARPIVQRLERALA